MSTTKEKIMAVARRVLREYETMSASGIAERVNSETRDGVHLARMAGMLRSAPDIEQVPRTREPIEWRLKGNLDATETGGKA